MKDIISIEYAHLYSDQQIDRTTLQSIDKARQLKNYFLSLNQKVHLSILLDDYHVQNQSWTKEELNKALSKLNLQPDLIYLESELVLKSSLLIKRLKKKEQKKINRYIEKHEYPCSLLTATWYALRLGHLENNFLGNKLINFLPVQYKEAEEKALSLLSKAQIDTNNIETIWV